MGWKWMRRVLAMLAVFAVFPSGVAQSFDAYLKLRKANGIFQAAEIEALETFVGTRTVEVKGRVCGYSVVNGKTVLLVERPEGDTLHIAAETTPEWLMGNDVDARLLVKATRESEMASLNVTLLNAATEYQMRQYEKAEAARSKKPTASRSKPARQKPPDKHYDVPASEATPIYAAFIRKRNPRLTNNEAYRIAAGIIGFSLKYGVDARLVMAMVLVESGFNPNATSHAGAMGLGQLMPGTAKGMGVSNAYDSIDNLYGTVRLIRGHLAKYGKSHGETYEALVLSLAAYNAGGGAVRKYGGVPPYKETQNYVRKVTAWYRALCGG